MILLSLNIRGVGGPLKFPSMRRLLSSTKPDIIFLQETLVDEEKARKFLFSLCPTWMYSAVSSVGKSGGLLVAWNPNIVELQPYLCAGGILLTGIHIPDKRRICLINVYGPCTGRRLFWEHLEAKGLLDQSNLILAGDLNFSMGVDEVWGVSALIDSQATFFRDLFTKHHLVDVKPSEVVPTWRNGRFGVDGIQKRLDRVYASEALLNDSALYRSWVELPFISDHAPVLFQLDYGIKYVSYPFKFNPVLLKDESFGELVREEWSTQQDSLGEGAQLRLVGKLFRLKARVKKWIAVKKKIDLQTLEKIEEEIAFLTKESLEHQTFDEPIHA
jgi:endonuclease/exonuclease/phosphatase family metal-dependent hydrolase